MVPVHPVHKVDILIPGSGSAGIWGTSCLADAVLLSLIGQDSVLSNRAFAAAGLNQSVLRFSCAIEENMLLAVGDDATDGIFVSAGYCRTLDARRNGAFRERYHSMFGDRAPTLNDLGQSVYEGLHRLAAHLPGAARTSGSVRRNRDTTNVPPVYYGGSAIIFLPDRQPDRGLAIRQPRVSRQLI